MVVATYQRLLSWFNICKYETYRMIISPYKQP